MIKNERQYRISKAQAAKFAHALKGLARAKKRPGVDPLWVELQEGALNSQLSELEHELREYEALQSGAAPPLSIGSLAELPEALIKARIAGGLSQAGLAARLGLKEQQIQRYEAHGYVGANLERLQEVMNALGIALKQDLSVSPAAASVPRLLARVKDAGISEEIVRKLVPKQWRRWEAEKADPSARESLVLQMAGVIGRVFRWSVEQLLGDDPLVLPSHAIVGLRYKLPSGRNELQTAAYTIYAHHLALLALQCTPDLLPTPVPQDHREVNEQIVKQYGTLSFDAVLRYLWDHGITVLPLSDSGTFHGACWRVNGRDVIVVKQRTRSTARWTIDLLHELYHTTENSDAPEAEVIEEVDVLASQTTVSEQERAATDFALAVALPEAEPLAQRCAQRAQGKVQWLKKAVQDVATEEHIDEGLLANYLAYRLSLQGINWWGAATALQSQGREPFIAAREHFFSNVKLDLLNDTDRDILEEALGSE